MNWNRSTKLTESGKITFHYTQLSPLKNEITPEPLPILEPAKKVKMLSFSKEYETDIITLFHAAGDFNYRSRWKEGVKKVEEINHFLPRVGMRCRCELENGQVVIYATSYSYNSERIEFSESEEGEKNISHYSLEKINDKRTKLTIDFYLGDSLTKQIIFRLFKKKMEDNFNKSLLNLAELVKEIKLPAQELPQ
jgi:hypothetical protein